MERIELKFIVDNKACDDLIAEHGFSVLVECFGKRILFDAGQNIFQDNIKKLHLDLKDIDSFILSHGHYDHAGGVEFLLHENKDLDVYLHPFAVVPRYSIREAKAKQIKMKTSSLTAINDYDSAKIHWISKPFYFSDNIILSGEIPRNNNFEDTGGPFFLDTEGEKIDPINDDMALIIKTSQGLVLICGCCHSGLVNTIDYAMSITNDTRIYALIGGFHLVNADSKRLRKTTDYINKIKPEMMIPCHCTGDEALKYLKNNTQVPIKEGFAGLSLSL